MLPKSWLTGLTTLPWREASWTHVRVLPSYALTWGFPLRADDPPRLGDDRCHDDDIQHPQMAHLTNLARWRMGSRNDPGPQAPASDSAGHRRLSRGGSRHGAKVGGRSSTPRSLPVAEARRGNGCPCPRPTSPRAHAGRKGNHRQFVVSDR